MEDKDTKHKQGPWRVELGPATYLIHTDAGGGTQTIIAEVCELENDVMETEKANAFLMAAAPELLEALHKLTDEINLQGLNIREKFSLINAHASAKKAIAKATGKLDHIEKKMQYTEDVRSVAQNAVAISEAIQSEVVYELLKDKVGGFPGVQMLYVDAAQEFSNAEPDEGESFDWPTAIHIYATLLADHVLEKGNWPDKARQEALAKRCINHTKILINNNNGPTGFGETEPFNCDMCGRETPAEDMCEDDGRQICSNCQFKR